MVTTLIGLAIVACLIVPASIYVCGIALSFLFSVLDAHADRDMERQLEKIRRELELSTEESITRFKQMQEARDR